MANQVSDWQLDCVELKQRGSHILQSGLWSDCTFCVGDQIIKAHRLILAMASPVLATMFYGSMPDTDPVLIEDVEPDTFKALLEYIYTDEVAVSSLDIAYELSYAAKKYMLPHLMQECSTYITSHLSPHNACRVYELAALLDDASLMEECMQVISENTTDVLNDSSFVDIEPTTVLQVLSLETMDIESEMELVNAVTRYNKQRTESTPESASSATTPGLDMRDQFTRDASEKIRFLTLTAKQFAEDPSLLSLLSAQDHLAVLMNITSSNSYIPMPNGFSVSRQPRNSAIRKNKMKSAAPSIESVYCKREYTPTIGRYCVYPACMVNFTVDRTVTLLGVQVPAQLMQSSNGSDTYQEYVEVCFSGSWPFNSQASYNNLVDIKFPRPVTLEEGENYSTCLKFCVGGHYPFGECSPTAIGREADPDAVKFIINKAYDNSPHGREAVCLCFCCKSFSQSNTMKLHVRTVHMKLPWPYKKKPRDIDRSSYTFEADI